MYCLYYSPPQKLFPPDQSVGHLRFYYCCLLVWLFYHSWPEFLWWSQLEGPYTEADLDLSSFLLWNLTPEQRHTGKMWVLSISWHHSEENPLVFLLSILYYLKVHPVFLPFLRPGSPALRETLAAMLCPESSSFLFKLMNGKWGVKAKKHSFFHEVPFSPTS